MSDLGEDAITRVVEIVNKKGLHARASAKFAQLAERYKSAITVSRGGETVGGTSIMGLMMLAAGPGTLITVKASGPDAIDAMSNLCDLVSSGFGEGLRTRMIAPSGGTAMAGRIPLQPAAPARRMAITMRFIGRSPF